jgi:hypothetical protein
MASDAPPGGLEIGQVLRDARQRAGLDIGTVEARTKIRTRYLRALENEEWDVLPGHAYAKGFLRTYAQLLGLDADALVDAYRRQVEAPGAGQYPLAEPVLQARRRGEEPGEPGRILAGVPERGWIVAGLVAALLAVLIVLGVTAGDDEEGEGPDGRGGSRPEQGKGEDRGQEAAAPPGLPLRVVARSAVQVCLLNGVGDVLLDEALAAGDSEQFASQRYELRFPDGFDTAQIDLFANGEPLDFEIDPQGPVAYEIEPPGRLTQLELASEGCP